MSPVLLILRGVPGSGKSTYAASTGYVVVNRDTIREQVTGDAENFTQERRVTLLQNEAIKHALLNGENVVVDNTNVEWQYVRDLAEIGRQCNAAVQTKVIDVYIDTALERNRLRGEAGGRRVPDYVIRHMYARLQKTKGYML